MKCNMVLQIVFMTSLALALSVGTSYSIEHQQLELYNENFSRREKICQRISVWEWEQFSRLQGCTVIEGSLQINMVFSNPAPEYSQNTSSSEHSEDIEFPEYHQNISFPELREITGFLMVIYYIK